MDLTIGMATYKDYDGVVFTVESLRLYHDLMNLLGPTKVEIMVVDNSPESPEGQAIQAFMKWLGMDCKATYVPYTEVNGTAAPRDLVFRKALGHAVLCLDSHVMLRPGSLTSFLRYIRDNPDQSDLIQGPLLYDDLRSISTHFDGKWGAEMWGKWQEAWRCKCGEVSFSLRFDLGEDKKLEHITFIDLWGEPIHSCPHCAHLFPITKDHRIIFNEGHRPAASRGDEDQPFEIPAQGLGLFGCRKDAWLGFNPKFRGFGGEEHYIHEKYRQAGRKTMCVPGLCWWHRFGKPSGVKYPLTRQDKVRNYVIGHDELKLPLDKAKYHFVTEAGMSEGEWNSLVGQARSAVEAKVGCGSCQASMQDPAGWYHAAETADEKMGVVRQLADQCLHVVELQPKRNQITAALMESRAATLYSCTQDLPARLVGHRSVHKHGLTMTLANLPPSEAPVQECDLLILGENSDRNIVEALHRHADSAKKWVVVIGGEIFGQSHGSLAGIRYFFKERPEYTCIRAGKDYHVLSKNVQEKQELPSTWKQIWNYTKALTKEAVAGFGNASPELIEERLKICSTCPMRNGVHCGKCGCPIEPKASFPTQSCPLGHWHAAL